MTEPATGDIPANATALAFVLQAAGWTVTGTAPGSTILADPGGTLRLNIDTANGRLGFNCPARKRPGGFRSAWKAQASLLTAAVITAVSEANDAPEAFVETDDDDDQFRSRLAEAGWQEVSTHYWTSPDLERDLILDIGNGGHEEPELPWRARRNGGAREIHLSEATPYGVICAFALSDDHPDPAAPEPLGLALTGQGWTRSGTAHPARRYDPDAQVWNSPGGQVMLATHGIRDGRTLISLYAPRTPDNAGDPLWQINGGPVPIQAAVAMASAALRPATGGGHTAGFTAAGWALAPGHALSVAVAGLEAWIGPPADEDYTGFWCAFLFPMPTPELSTWTVKGAHAGLECCLLATASTPAHVIAAAATGTTS
jgi:hypothetical protein